MLGVNKFSILQIFLKTTEHIIYNSDYRVETLVEITRGDPAPDAMCALPTVSNRIPIFDDFINVSAHSFLRYSVALNAKILKNSLQCLKPDILQLIMKNRVIQ